ncbi:MAG: hypothetical protein JW849_01565 [Phycisphaerae bacterium]|nr:hypothetical protein [Phycisphaerae bacterium]
MNTELSQSDQQRLSAWMDGELPPAEAEAVARLVETDAAWSLAWRRLQALERTLDRWEVPTPAADLVDRVLAHARRRPEGVVFRVGRWLLSAAAVMLIGLGLALHFAQKRPSPVGPRANLAQGGLVNVPESFVRDNVDLFHDMPETIPAKGPVRIVIRRAAGTTTQPAVRILSWNQLTPQQQQAVRRRAVIFLRLSPEQQVRLLRAHERALRRAKLQQQQMRWLKAVLESFTPEERAALSGMSPAQRSEMFLQRRNELLQAGKLPPDTHTTPFHSPSSSDSPVP